MGINYNPSKWENGKTVIKASHFEKIEKGITDIINYNNSIYTDEDKRKENEIKREEEHNKKLEEIDSAVKDMQADYDSLQKVIIDENASANLQNQINNVNSQLAHIEKYPILDNEVGVTKPEYKYGNVLRYGAIQTWNSTKNDSIAFQNCIDSAKKLKCKVIIPKGEYVLKSTIILPKEVTIEGESRNWDNGTVVQTYCNEVFKSETSETNIILKNIQFRKNGSDTSILFSNIQFSNSLISDNYFIGYDVVFLGSIVNCSIVFRNSFKTIKSFISKTFGDFSCVHGGVVDSRITHNYINGDLRYRSLCIDVPIATSSISNNYIDFFYVIFNNGENDGAIISNNTLEYSFNIFKNKINSTVICNNDIRRCSKVQASRFENPTQEMINNEWVCINIDNNNGTSNAIISDNLVSYSDTFLYLDGSLNKKIKSCNNIFNDVKNKVIYNVKSGYGSALTNMYIEEMSQVEHSNLPNPKLTGDNIQSYDKHEIYYNNKLLRNNKGRWLDLMGNEITS